MLAYGCIPLGRRTDRQAHKARRAQLSSGGMALSPCSAHHQTVKLPHEHFPPYVFPSSGDLRCERRAAAQARALFALPCAISAPCSAARGRLSDPGCRRGFKPRHRHGPFQAPDGPVREGWLGWSRGGVLSARHPTPIGADRRAGTRQARKYDADLIGLTKHWSKRAIAKHRIDWPQSRTASWRR